MIIFGILAGGFAGETIGQILTKIKIMSENNSSTNQDPQGGMTTPVEQGQFIGGTAGAKAAVSPGSIGAQRVGISFNPSADHRVDSIKQKAAILINEIHEYFQLIESSEAKRCFAVAMTEVESAAMWAVKGVTKK